MISNDLSAAIWFLQTTSKFSHPTLCNLDSTLRILEVLIIQPFNVVCQLLPFAEYRPNQVPG